MSRLRPRLFAGFCTLLATCLASSAGAILAADPALRLVARTPQAPSIIASSAPVAAPITIELAPPTAIVAPTIAPEPFVALGRPVAATLGRPVALAPVAVADDEGPPMLLGSAILPVAYETDPQLVRFQSADVPPPASVQPPVLSAPSPPLSAGDPGNGGYFAPGPDPATYNGVPVDRPLTKPFWDRCRDWLNFGDKSSHSGGWFCSDHAFDNGIISPVSSPFFFEDPRALTEVRPMVIYQHSPSSNPAFHSGSSEYFGTQARLAFNDRWSLVINKFGVVAFQPSGSDFPDSFSNKSGFAEFNIGPKWTFLRNEQAGRVAALGLTLELPVGSNRVFQDTGSLGLDPYITFGQSFGKSSYGGFNFLAAGGYSFGVDNSRTEYLHGHLHLDYDVGNLHRIYPLVELNWLHSTKFGSKNDFNAEGGDLANFGSPAFNGKRDLLTLAFGARYKFGGSDHYQVGTSFEFPLTNRKDIQDFRFGLDFILRY